MYSIILNIILFTIIIYLKLHRLQKFFLKFPFYDTSTRKNLSQAGLIYKTLNAKTHTCI